MKDRIEDWEAKCNKCGSCCHDRVVLKDAIVINDTHCEHLGDDNLCKVYSTRFDVYPECIKTTPKNVNTLGLPPTCGLLK